MGISSEDHFQRMHRRHQFLLPPGIPSPLATCQPSPAISFCLFFSFFEFISSIVRLVLKILSYGRNKAVILDASRSDPSCVLANTLAANFLFNHNPSKALSHLQSASLQLVTSVSPPSPPPFTVT